MDIAHTENGGSGAFTTGEGAERAELTYTPGPSGTLVFDHTFVPPALRGRGIAEKLVEQASAYARDKGMKVEPACPYVRRLYDRHPERYGDLRA